MLIDMLPPKTLAIKGSTVDEREPNKNARHIIRPTPEAWNLVFTTSKNDAMKFESYTPRKRPKENIAAQHTKNDIV